MKFVQFVFDQNRQLLLQLHQVTDALRDLQVHYSENHQICATSAPQVQVDTLQRELLAEVQSLRDQLAQSESLRKESQSAVETLKREFDALTQDILAESEGAFSPASHRSGQLQQQQTQTKRPPLPPLALGTLAGSGGGGGVAPTSPSQSQPSSRSSQLSARESARSSGPAIANPGTASPSPRPTPVATAPPPRVAIPALKIGAIQRGES